MPLYIMCEIELNNWNVGLTNDEVTAQAMLFLLAGYETTATTLSFIMYHMAVYPEYQEKVYQEILDNFSENVNCIKNG